jgi:hypothetical protein
MLFWSVGVLLTNAYKVYLRVNEDEGVVAKKDGLLTHYEFRKAIALYWIHPEESQQVSASTPSSRGSRSFDAMRSPPSLSDMTTTDSSYVSDLLDKRRSASCTDLTLAENGALRCRMDRTLDHFPVKAAPKVKCAVHRWVGFRKEGELLYCPQCNVNLCVHCYGIFHRCPNLVSIKEFFRHEFEVSGDSLDSSRNKKKRAKRA